MDRLMSLLDACGTEICEICGAVRPSSLLSNGVCLRCRQRIELLPGPYAIDSDGGEDTWIYTAFEYGGAVTRLIERIKLSGQRELVGLVARLVAKRIFERIKAESGEIAVTPIPASRRGVRCRGFDQSLVLARHIASICGDSFQLAPVIGRRRGLDQKHLERVDRFANISRQLVLRRAIPRVDTVVLIDDVVTTGASMLAARDLIRSSACINCVGIAFALRA